MEAFLSYKFLLKFTIFELEICTLKATFFKRTEKVIYKLLNWQWAPFGVEISEPSKILQKTEILATIQLALPPKIFKSLLNFLPNKNQQKSIYISY